MQLRELRPSCIKPVWITTRSWSRWKGAKWKVTGWGERWRGAEASPCPSWFAEGGIGRMSSNLWILGLDWGRGQHRSGFLAATGHWMPKWTSDHRGCSQGDLLGSFVLPLFPNLAFMLLLSREIPVWGDKLKPQGLIKPEKSTLCFKLCPPGLLSSLRNIAQADPLNPSISQHN